MKKYAKIIATFGFLIGCGVAANAEMQDDMIVNLRFEFVVSGVALPAGIYTVSHSLGNDSGILKLTNRAEGTSVFILPNVNVSGSFDNPHVSFQRIGEARFLSEIRTASEAYQIPISHRSIMQATAKSHDSVSASVGSGSE
jgi:hypothetical protein